MKILITGGAGFIGSHLVEKLLAKGDKVLVIDNYATGRQDNLKKHPNLEIVEDTISNTDTVDTIFSRFSPDKVIHAAASYKDPENWLEDGMTNVIGTINIVKAAKKQNVKRIIYFQTSLCYGLKPLQQPITLAHPYFSGSYPGGSSYAISKTGGEQYVELSGLDFISFRLANAFGPRNLSGPLPTFYNRIMNKKPLFIMDTRRDFIFVNDLVDVVMKAVDGMGEKGYYHISSGKDYSVKDLYDATIKALGIKPEKEAEIRQRNPDDVATLLIDPSKTNKTFNWKTTTPLEVGVKAAIDWYKTHDMAQTYTHLKNIEKK